MGPREAGIALAVISLANIIGTYLSGYLGGLMRRKYLLSVIYLVRSAAMILFWRCRSAKSPSTPSPS